MYPIIKLLKTIKNRIHNYFYPIHYPAGHFYSPITNVKDMAARQEEIFTIKTTTLPDIDLSNDVQFDLLQSLSRFYNEVPFTESKNSTCRYYYNNVHFCHTDAILLQLFIRHFKPKRIIEAGSGFSSAVMLDTNDLFMNKSVHFTFIEPYPKRLYSLLREEDKSLTTIVPEKIQNVNYKVFEALEENDILFIDSTHVSKTGSDVNYVLFEILPRLKKGVIIHFHDIFYPFEYPKEWVLGKGFGWNEDYILRAFLMYNQQFKTLLFNTHMHFMHKTWFEKNMPLCLKNTGGSIYLRKMS